MKLDLIKSLEILDRTPMVLRQLLEGLSDDWTKNNEGGETWSPYDVIGHLLHGEKTDWTERVSIILAQGENRTFTPFDRFAQFNDSKGKSLTQLLDEFADYRKKNLDFIKRLNIQESQYALRGIHPALGEVSLSQLLATWTVHDLNHLAQISRVMAKQYMEEVGPWKEYLRILQ